ncbi:MAG TPA: c-type cytochrome [Anaerolineales bacterium]|nr:c-type cytochrome [Anaerolineales bacterium]
MPELVVEEAGVGRTSTPDGPARGLSPGYQVAALGALTLFTGAGFYAATRSRAAVAAALAGGVVLASGLLLVPRAQAAAETLPVESKTGLVETTPRYDQGRVLFQAKGCIVCHGHDELRVGFTGITTDIGPNFTWGTKRPVEFLRSWLADPQAIRPDTAMPNLELSESEIETLAVFLMGELDQ